MMLPTLQLEMEEEPPKEQIHPIVERLITLGFAKEDMGGAWEVAQTKAVEVKTAKQTQAAKREEQAELAHLQKMAEMAGVPLEVLAPNLAAKPAA
jgi:hypothetical protein